MCHAAVCKGYIHNSVGFILRRRSHDQSVMLLRPLSARLNLHPPLCKFFTVSSAVFRHGGILRVLCGV